MVKSGSEKGRFSFVGLTFAESSCILGMCNEACAIVKVWMSHIPDAVDQSTVFRRKNANGLSIR